MLAVTYEASGSSAVTNSPSNLPKRPRTFDTMRCRTENPISVCVESMSQVPVM